MTRQSPGAPLRGTSGYESRKSQPVARSAPPGALRESTRQSPGEPLRDTSGYESRKSQPVARSTPPGALRESMRRGPGAPLPGTSGYAEHPGASAAGVLADEVAHIRIDHFAPAAAAEDAVVAGALDRKVALVLRRYT
jgi:hypothetical protein